ncbi:MAG: hypothetical protein AAF280_14840 [Pseudomonadota bacterium]
MMDALHVGRLRGVIEILEKLDPSARLEALKKLITNNGGTWDLPSQKIGADGNPIYMPALMSLNLFGVYAMAEVLEELPRNWMKAAQNILDANKAGETPEDARV